MEDVSPRLVEGRGHALYSVPGSCHLVSVPALIIPPHWVMGYHVPILQLALLGMKQSLFHPTTCYLCTLLMDIYGAGSVPTVGMAHTHPTSGYSAVSIPTYNMSPSHTTRGYGAVSIPSQGAMVHSHSGGIIPGSGIPTACIGTTVPRPPLIPHNQNHHK